MDALATGMAGLAVNTIMDGGDGFAEQAKSMLTAAANEKSGMLPSKLF